MKGRETGKSIRKIDETNHHREANNGCVRVSCL